MATPTGPQAAGWYPDPESPSELRYWDGQAWTNQRHPAPPPGTSAMPPGTPPAPGPAGQPTGHGLPGAPVAGRPGGNWFARHKGLTIGGAVALVLLCICGTIINAVS